MNLRDRLRKLEQRVSASGGKSALPEYLLDWTDEQLLAYLEAETGIPAAELTDEVLERIAAEGGFTDEQG